MTGLRVFLTSRLTWASVAFVVTFAAILWLYEQRAVAEITRTVLTALAFVGSIGYARVAVRAYATHRWPNPELLAALASFLVMAGIGFDGTYRLIWRFGGFDNRVIDSGGHSFVVALIAAGIFILVATPNLVGRTVPWKERWLTVAAWAIAIFAVLGLMVFTPNLRWLSDLLARL